MSERRPVVEIIDPVMVDCFRRMSPGQKLNRAFDMWEFAMSVMAASIRRDHPEWSPAEVHREKLRRLGRSVPE